MSIEIDGRFWLWFLHRKWDLNKKKTDSNVNCTKVDWNVHRLKCSYDDDISANEDFFDQWDPSTETSMWEVCGKQRGLWWKKTSFGHIPWESGYELLNRASYHNLIVSYILCISKETNKLSYVIPCIFFYSFLFSKRKRPKNQKICRNQMWILVMNEEIDFIQYLISRNYSNAEYVLIA